MQQGGGQPQRDVVTVQQQDAPQSAASPGGLSLDEAVAQAAGSIEERIAAGSKIALLNFNSPSAKFSAYVLDELTAILVESRKLTVVDRKEIDLIRSEVIFQMSGEVSDESIQQAGQKLGAQSIVSGSLTELDGFYRIVIRVLNVESAAVEVQYRTNIVNDNIVAALLIGAGTGGAAAKVDKYAPPEVAGMSAFTDPRDDRSYRTVLMGSRTWMAENLNYRPREGNSWCYESDEALCQNFGRLYDWNTAMDACPDGWSLPNRKDWDDMIWETGEKESAGTKLKSRAGWNNDGNGTDEFGFSGLPGGTRLADGSFGNAYTGGNWWIAAEFGANNAYYRYMYSGYDYVIESNTNKRVGFSIRCVRDD